MNDTQKSKHEQVYSEITHTQKEQKWNEENAIFIESYNESYNKIVETEGVVLQEWRTF